MMYGFLKHIKTIFMGKWEGKSFDERMGWIDSIRGIACMIVMLGHNVALIFPVLYFGYSYKTNNPAEYAMHGSPLNLFWNASAVVPLFFVISGYFLYRAIDNKNKTWCKICINRFFRFLPMIALGICIAFVVMKAKLVYSIPLVEFSQSKGYADIYNNFLPSILGKDGIIIDIFIRSFTKGSKYITPLWYRAAAFIGTILLVFYGRCLLKIKSRRKQIAGWLIAAVLFLVAGKIIDWKLQYISAMIAGILLAMDAIRFDHIPVTLRRLLIIPSILIISVGGAPE